NSITGELLRDASTAQIGTPIPNTQIYIVDEGYNLSLPGTIGEVCISGAGLARGYLNQELLTAEKFVPNPFLTGERMYRTGDLARWMPDGNVEYLGRKDNQVKSRGHRIELGEIENVLQGYMEVDAAVVTARSNAGGAKALVAYIVSRAPIDISSLRTHLGRTLPAYMVPGHYVQLDEMPLMPNGKINKNNLPDPSQFGLETAVAYVGPRNEIEEKLVVIWRELLGQE